MLPADAVGDRDLCLLNTMVFESPDSSGSSCQGGIYNAEEGACIPLPPYAIRSGPRRNIYFRPEQVPGYRIALLQLGHTAQPHLAWASKHYGKHCKAQRRVITVKAPLCR